MSSFQRTVGPPSWSARQAGRQAGTKWTASTPTGRATTINDPFYLYFVVLVGLPSACLPAYVIAFDRGHGECALAPSCTDGRMDSSTVGATGPWTYALRTRGNVDKTIMVSEAAVG